MTTEWKIRRKHGHCSLCGHAFEDGERLRSLLCVEEAEVVRRDVCEGCRAATPDETELAERVRHAAEAERAAAAATNSKTEAATPETNAEAAAGESHAPFALYWWSTRHQASKRATVQLDLETIERLFLDLEGRPEEKLRELRYLLCLLLMRKRRVKLDAVRRGADGEALLVHRPRHEERLVVYVHDFGPERMDELRARLQALLEGVEPEALDEVGAEREPSDADADADDSHAEQGGDAEAGDSGVEATAARRSAAD